MNLDKFNTLEELAPPLKTLISTTSDIPAFVDAKLTANASATDTTIDVNRLPTGAIANGIWVIIDPWTVQCEIRKVTGISSSTLTIAALTYGHSIDDGIIYSTDPIYNVKLYGAVGNGSTDDTAAIQACIDDSVAGSVIYFPDVGPYIIDGVVYKESRHYLGTFHAGDVSTLKFKSSASSEAMFIDTNYYNNVTTATHRCTFEHLAFDGNRTNNTAGHGIICQGQRTYFYNCEFYQIDEDAIHFTDETADATPITENCIGNRIQNCRIEYIDDYGVFAPDGSRFTDGYLIDCHINNIDGVYAVYIGSGSGWVVSGNHLWQIEQEAIRLKNAGHSFVVHNYIEQYGRTASLGTIHALWVHAGAIAVIANNIIRNAQTQAGNTYYTIFAQGSGAGDGRFVIADNLVNANASAEEILRIEESVGFDVYATVTGNFFYNGNPLVSQASTVVTNVYYEGNSFQFRTAAPSSGWWPQGMRVHNQDTDAKDVLGWVCITSGTSGTWRNFGEVRDTNGYIGDHARVNRTAVQSITDSTWTAINFTAEDYDNNTLHDTATNNTRFTIARDGIYNIGASVRFAANTTGQRGVRITIDGTTVIAMEYGDTYATGTTTWRRTISTNYELTASQYVEVEVYQSSGGNLNIDYVADYSPFFWISKVG